jgi:HD-GYP domain-containing protein (c-di-GMP phosphodiesterase class II)
MEFDMTKCLSAFAMVLDYVELEHFKVKLNHSRRVAYIALQLGRELELDAKDTADLYALSLLHDSGLTASALELGPSEFELNPGHCIAGEETLIHLPLQRKRENIIRYHHENYDGTGLFKVGGDEIPLLSNVIHMADTLDRAFFGRLSGGPILRDDVAAFVAANDGTIFSPVVVEAFLSIASRKRFWSDLAFNEIADVLNRVAPRIVYEYDWKDIVPISETFMRISDAKSIFMINHSRGLTEKVAALANHLGFDDETKVKLQIAANLHDMGKLGVPNAILDKPTILTPGERREVEKHAYLTRLVLEYIPWFEEIAQWAASHHERLNGSGYPDALGAADLGLEARLIAVLDIYQAITEERAYRRGLSHGDTMKVLCRLSQEGLVDGDIVDEVGNLFK